MVIVTYGLRISTPARPKERQVIEKQIVKLCDAGKMHVTTGQVPTSFFVFVVREGIVIPEMYLNEGCNI